MEQTQSQRPMVKWRVTLHYRIDGLSGVYGLGEVYVLAPENDLQAAAKAGWIEWAQLGDRPSGAYVTRIDVTRIDLPEPTSQHKQNEQREQREQDAHQCGLWDEALEVAL